MKRFLLFLFGMILGAQGANIHYTLQITDPGRHLANITIEVPVNNADTLAFAMPAWSPGRYVIYNFSQNVFAISAHDEHGHSIRPLLIDKQTWQVPCRGKKRITFRYRIFAHTLDGTFSSIDTSGASLNGASLFMYVRGRKHWPVLLDIQAPPPWRIVTGFGNRIQPYHAPNYDVFIDTPIEMGTLFTYSFNVLNKPHTLVFHRPLPVPLLRTFKNDLQKVIRFHASLFGDSLPYPHYTFFFHLSPDLPHPDGMEHLNACRVMLRMNIDSVEANANTDPDYDNLIWLSAHEFFHTWNVKRLRPAGLGPFDYSREVYTPSLWIVEGWTSYYAYLALLRTGIYTPQKWLSEIAGRITRYERNPGKKYRTLAETSILTWLFKGHVPRFAATNIDTTTYSYYYKGLIAGFLLDALLRSETNGRYSLDDLLRAMWHRFYLTGQTNYYLPGQGYTEQEIEALIVEKLGAKGREFLRRVVHSTAPLPYDLAQNLGLKLEWDAAKKRYRLTKLISTPPRARKYWQAFLKGGAGKE